MNVQTKFCIADDVWYFGSGGLLYRGIVSMIHIRVTVSGVFFIYECIGDSPRDKCHIGRESTLYASEEEALKVAMDRLLH